MQRTLIIVAASTASLFFTGFLFFQVHGDLSVQEASGATPREASSGAALSDPPVTMTPGPGPTAFPKAAMLEVHIANTGAVLLRGATVVSLSKNAIHVVTRWSPVDLVWEVRTKLFTQFTSSNGGKEAVADIHVGDTVTITGMLVSGGAEPVLDAQFVKEYYQ